MGKSSLDDNKKYIKINKHKLCFYKSMIEKYTMANETIFDFNIESGERILAAGILQRKYFGAKPLAYSNFFELKSYFDFDNITLIDVVSENLFLGDDMADFVFLGTLDVVDNVKQVEYISRMVRKNKFIAIDSSDEDMINNVNGYFRFVEEFSSEYNNFLIYKNLK